MQAKLGNIEWRIGNFSFQLAHGFEQEGLFSKLEHPTIVAMACVGMLISPVKCHCFGNTFCKNSRFQIAAITISMTMFVWLQMVLLKYSLGILRVHETLRLSPRNEKLRFQS